jgi:hypothetical protein
MYVLPARLPEEARPSERLLAWAMAYSVAENFGATFVTRGLCSDAAPCPNNAASSGSNGSSSALVEARLLGEGGWEAFLGLAQALEGEITWGALLALHPAGAPLRTVALPGWEGVRYDEDVFRRGPWWDLFNSPEHCGAAFQLPATGGRSWDVVWLSKPAAAAKYAQARALQQATKQQRHAVLPWGGQRGIHVAVHVRWVRVGDGAPPPTAQHPFLDTGAAAWVPEDAGASGCLGGGSSNGRSTQRYAYYPTEEAALARVVGGTVLPALARAAEEAGVSPTWQGAGVHIHVFSEHEEAGEGGRAAALFPSLAALGQGGGAAGVAFYGPSQVGAWAAFHALTAADVLVGSASQWSTWAAHFSHRPLVLAQPDTDKWRQCGEGEACCLASGVCPFPAAALMMQAARRLVAREASHSPSTPA